MKKYLLKREVGFTLIELLTVVIIIGVLAAIAIPVFSAQKSRAQDSQTISDVKNIATAAETVLADRTKTVADLSQSSTEYQSSKNVFWNIKGNTTTGGYCIAAYNASGKDYKSTSTLLTYDSTAGGLKKSGGSCDTGQSSGANTPNVTSSTFGGNFIINAAAANLSLTRSSSAATTVGLSWTASSDVNVTGYKIERSINGGSSYNTITTISGRTNSTYSDTAAGATHVYYKITPMIGTTASASVLTGAAFTSPGGDSYSQTGSVQTFTVPDTGIYQISTWGGQGGSYSYSGGSGGVVSANYSLTAGQQISVVVASVGQNYYYGSSGGGGSFVYITGQAQPLQVAGGGGGDTSYYCGATGGNANTGNGNGSYNPADYAGGTSWNYDSGTNGYGGGGRNANGSWSGGSGGQAGAYGGGGSGGYNNRPGGGGGYQGGRYGGSTGCAAEGGYNYVNPAATSVSNSNGSSGSGKVFITEISN